MNTEVTLKFLKDRKIASDKERVPLMVQATASLRSTSARYGFAHVQCNPSGKYYAFYKGLDTGLQLTPMLAAYELLKLAKQKRVVVTDKLEVEYYPECFLNVDPSIDLAAIEYLREPAVKAGWKGIKLRTTNGKRTFACVIDIDGITYRSKAFPTPVEAAWAIHVGKAKTTSAYVLQPDTKGPIDLSIIDYLQEGSGYKNVHKFNGGFRGRLSVNGHTYHTEVYPQREQAAWALHHHLATAPKVVPPDSGAVVANKALSEYKRIVKGV